MAYQRYTVEQPLGVNFTKEPAQLPDKVWDGVENIAFRHGITKKVDGYAEGLGKTGTANDNSKYPISVLALRDDTQNYYWWAYVAGDESGYTITRVLSQTQHNDATPSGGIPHNMEYRWSNDSIVSVPYFTYGSPYKWDGTSQFVPYVYFPDHVKMRNIRTYKNFHIGLNFSTTDFDPQNPPSNWNTSIGSSERTEYASKFGSWSTGDYQSGVWWSADVRNDDTDVSWADADPTSPSGWNLLGGAGGPIIDGKVLRDSFIIYRERAVWQMTYVGGINVFAFKELFTDVGCLGPECIAEVDGWHFVVGQSDVYAHNGVQKKSIADGVIRNLLFKSIDPNYIRNVFIATKYHDKELWVCIPEAGTNVNGKCNRAFVYNWEENTWTIKSMPNSLSATYAIISSAESITTWLDDKYQPGVEGSSWAEQTDIWISSQYEYNPSQWGLVFGGDKEGTEGAIYTSTEQPLNNGENFEAKVEKKWMDMGDRSAYKTINKVYPFVRNGKVRVYISGTSTIMESPVWKYLGEFDSLERMYLSGHATGRFLHLKFEIPKESRAEIRGFDVEYSVSGGR